MKRILVFLLILSMSAVFACGSNDESGETQPEIPANTDEPETVIPANTDEPETVELTMQSDTSELEASLEAQQERIEALEQFKERIIALETENEELRELIEVVESSITDESVESITVLAARIIEDNPETLRGPAGPQGPVGPAGADGADGADGATGPAGADGSDGSAGPQGVQGAKGDQGIQGPEGPQGVQGPTGPTGAQGDPGAAGVLNLEVVSASGSITQTSACGIADYCNNAMTYAATGPACPAGKVLIAHDFVSSPLSGGRDLIVKYWDINTSTQQVTYYVQAAVVVTAVSYSWSAAAVCITG